MHLTHKLQPRASFALIYVFAGACVFFTIVRLVLVFAQGPEFARTFLFDMSYSSNGAGFERRLFWTGLSGVPLFVLALIATSLDGRRFCIAFSACVALSVLPAIFSTHPCTLPGLRHLALFPVCPTISGSLF